MSLQTVGFRVVMRGESRPGKTGKDIPLSAMFVSKSAAIAYLELARKVHPDGDIFVESVQKRERFK